MEADLNFSFLCAKHKLWTWGKIDCVTHMHPYAGMDVWLPAVVSIRVRTPVVTMADTRRSPYYFRFIPSSLQTHSSG